MQARTYCTSLRILFVEDHADTADVFGRALEARGHRIWIAPDRAAALMLGQGEYFDLLICDLALPDGDGCNLLPTLRQLGTPDLRGIIFSALGSADDLKRAQAAGYEAHLLKPVAMEQLFAVIDMLCAMPRPRTDAKSQFMAVASAGL